MRSIFTVLAAAAMTFTAAAQEAPAGTAPAGYYDGKSYESFGWRSPYNNYSQAVIFKDANLKGKKIKAVKLSKFPVGLKNLKVWGSTKLGAEPDGQVIEVGDPTTEEVMVTFTEPIEIKTTRYYIGYSMDQPETGDRYSAVQYCSPKHISGAMWVMEPDGTWRDYSGSYGALLMTFYVETDFKANSLELEKVANSVQIEAGKSATIPVEVVNYGNNEVTSVEYTYEYNGAKETGTVELAEPLMALMTSKQQLEIPVKPISAVGAGEMTLTITKVNGQANNWASNSVQVPLCVTDFSPVHRPFMEEGTGTNCGYCPRGMVGMSELAKKYPDFVAAAYHRYNSSDPMYLTSSPVNFTGYPGSMIDRGETIDPFFGSEGGSLGIENDYLAAKAVASPAMIDLEAQWNAAKDSILISTDVRFAAIEKGQTYKIGYIVTIDSLCHKGMDDEAAWTQGSYYSGSEADPLLDQICKGTFDLKTFNHVGINVTDGKGVKESLPLALALNTVYNHKHVIAVSDCIIPEEVQVAPEHVKVIAILLNKASKVRNAREVTVGEKSTPDPAPEIPEDGINGIIGDTAASVVYYNLQGVQVANPENGIFIKKQGANASKVAL